MAEEVILLDFWPSPYAMRVRIALREKGVDFDSREEDLSNKSPLLLKMNPVHKQIPVLIHKGRSVCESSIIVQYIDELWSHKSPLLPSDPYKRSQARFWVDYVDKKVIPTARLIWDAAPEEVQEATKKELLQSFKLLEDELGDKIYFGGDNFGFVDVCLIPLYSLFYAIEMSAGFSIAEECPKLVAWAKGCMQRESVSETLPDQYKVYDFLRERKEKKKKKTQTK